MYFGVSIILFGFYCLKNIECICYFFFNTKNNFIEQFEHCPEEQDFTDDNYKYKLRHKKDIREFAKEVNENQKRKMSMNKKKDIVREF